MTNAQRKPIPLLTDEEEARIQAGIAADPDNPELTDEELAAMRPAKDVLPPSLYAALTGTKLPTSGSGDGAKEKRELYRRAGKGVLAAAKLRRARKKRIRLAAKRVPSKQIA
ncbi:hypothetical protein [Aureimonas sp. Leaf324]|uniref:hypothetical protein n=1 Tax=Aureimonas sp. Leaf324 TaxID=1736336 RepID=UPI0006F286F5|nr:hypothetical protein [Aureimonas sp. Leaf324]KQQ83635.1 hypothetical protein ASF65_20435 [Aureimonas sp. Leaf324]